MYLLKFLELHILDEARVHGKEVGDRVDSAYGTPT